MFKVPETQLKYLEEQPLFYKGVIEDDKDPTECNKYRVRLIGLDSEDLPTDMLPWATVLNNITRGVGISTFYKKGQFVLVHLFQNLRNQPIIMGSIQENNNQNEELKVFKDPSGVYPRQDYKTKPDTNQKAIGEKYLKNYVFETETGHYVEIDDSEQDGRIHIYHRTGSLILIDNDGNISINCVKNQTETIQDNLTINIKSGNTVIDTNSGTTYIHSQGQTDIKCNSDINVDSDANINIKAGGDVNIKGSNINLN